MSLTKNILIADDHTIVLKGLTYIFRTNFPNCVIREAQSIQEVLHHVTNTNITHLILDLSFADGNSIDYIPTIIEENPLIYILVYSMASEDVFARKLLEMDTSGFLSKNSTETETVQALKIFMEGSIYKSTHLKNTLQESNKTPGENHFGKLSISELRVLGLILNGKRSKEISAEMHLANQTIATFKSRIFKKLGTNNIFEIKKIAELGGIRFP